MIAAKMQHRIFLSGKAGAFSFLLPDKEEAMNQLDKNIAVNLKRIRKSKNMSLDMLAERTGVSKSMLGQIERGIQPHGGYDSQDCDRNPHII